MEASFEQTHAILFNWLHVEEDLTTEAAQANKQAGGVATDGVMYEARTKAKETYESILSFIVCCLFGM